MTRSGRLDAALVKCGAATVDELTAGQWSGGVCPYSISTIENDGRRITIDKGDVLLRASGPTLADALTALEAKIG